MTGGRKGQHQPAHCSLIVCPGRLASCPYNRALCNHTGSSWRKPALALHTMAWGFHGSSSLAMRLSRPSADRRWIRRHSETVQPTVLFDRQLQKPPVQHTAGRLRGEAASILTDLMRYLSGLFL
jgi:hypothetical protein